MKKQAQGTNEENLIDLSAKENTDSSNLSAVSLTDASIDDDDSVLQTHTHTPQTNAKITKVPLLFSGNYFQIISQNSLGVKAKCVTCQEVYSASKRTTSNFITHLKVRKLIL